jgi:hypothetical protein
MAAGPFDVIIDDGGHSDNQMLTSLFELLYGGVLRPGGLYFVEDLACNFENIGHYRDNRYLSDYFRSIILSLQSFRKSLFIDSTLKTTCVLCLYLFVFRKTYDLPEYLLSNPVNSHNSPRPFMVFQMWMEELAR